MPDWYAVCQPRRVRLTRLVVSQPLSEIYSPESFRLERTARQVYPAISSPGLLYRPT
ncbi:hypothetical protein MESS4_130010 [Mesorhizobium sp. STM 4661]|nr:hypothetical protein MESS4_130010 [Mesorhizobium sp. STM 4661]